MRLKASSYIAGNSPIHGLDARVKIVLLAAYSVTLFLVDSWVGLALCALLSLGAMGASRVSLRRYFGMLAPVYVMVALTIAFNALSFDVGQANAASFAGSGGAGAGAFAALPAVALFGSFGFVPAGFARGCFYAARVVLLVATSLVATYTTTSTDMTGALGDFMGPLRRLKVPVDDVAMVFSLALRFIPVTAEEFGRVHDAQWARGAAFGEGGLWARLRAWQTVLIPLFVGLFRRADALAAAMDARCYGAEGRRTSLRERRLSAASALVLAAGLALLAALAVWF